MAETKPAAISDAAQARLAASDDEKKKIVENVDKRHNVRPTPTQRECDLAALGQSVLEKEDDGSGPDPVLTRHMEPKKPAEGGSYQTREARAGTGGAHSGGHRQSSPTT
jgi:hypothetical protein